MNTNFAPHPLAVSLTVADLRVGDLFGWGPGAAAPSALVRRVDPVGAWGVRVTWDNGSRHYTRIMPKGNRVEVIR